MTERKPVTLQCAYCNQTIYEDEDYSRESEYGPDCHDACDKIENDKRAQEHRKYISNILAKEARGEELTFDELFALDMHMHNAMIQQMLLGPKQEVAEDTQEGVLRPTLMYASIQLTKPDDDKKE